MIDIKDVKVGDILIYHMQSFSMTIKYKVTDVFEKEIKAVVIEPDYLTTDPVRLFAALDLVHMEKEDETV